MAPALPTTLATSFCESVSGRNKNTTGPVGDAVVLAAWAADIAAPASTRKMEDNILGAAFAGGRRRIGGYSRRCDASFHFQLLNEDNESD